MGHRIADGCPLELLDGQIIHGEEQSAIASLRKGGSITISDQIAAEHHVGVGDILASADPDRDDAVQGRGDDHELRMEPRGDPDEHQRLHPSLGVTRTLRARRGSEDRHERRRGTRGDRTSAEPGNGLEVLTAKARETAIDTSASEGLGQLGEISTLLVAAAILAMAAALGASIWQRRPSLSELRLEGSSRRQLRLVLLVESALMLSAGCLTGAIAGIYGQIVIDGYLKHVTGFPVASLATGQRPIEIFALVIAAVLVIVAFPAWRASRVSATLALNE